MLLNREKLLDSGQTTAYSKSAERCRCRNLDNLLNKKLGRLQRSQQSSTRNPPDVTTQVGTVGTSERGPIRLKGIWEYASVSRLNELIPTPIGLVQMDKKNLSIHLSASGSFYVWRQSGLGPESGRYRHWAWVACAGLGWNEGCTRYTGGAILPSKMAFWDMNFACRRSVIMPTNYTPDGDMACSKSILYINVCILTEVTLSLPQQ